MTEENKKDCCCCGNEHEHDHVHGEDCNCEEVETLTLTLDDDTELECVVLGIFDYENNSYIALLPQEDNEEEEILIYEYKEINEEEVELNVIENEELFDKVSKEFEEIYFEEE